jgi:pSer/pThr/pTyr-binding forkhead associated (FHA) protein
MIELRILSGARAGHVERFTKSVISIGRHALNDLRLDQERDIEASRRHAEIRVVDGRMMVHDLSSTNGTWVNGERVEDEHQIRSGDVVSFGREGPRVEVHVTSDAASVAGASPMASPPQSAPPTPPKVSRPTPVAARESARLATRNQMPKLMAGAAVLVVFAAATAYWAGQRGNGGIADSAQQFASATQQAAGAMDLPQINARNANAVAFLAYEIAGNAYAGTAFCVDGGMLITNRHNVQNSSGLRASRLAAKFRDTHEWVPLRVVAVAGAQDDDLALLQIETPGVRCPATVKLASDASSIPEGSPVVTIGFPLALDARMEGTGNDFVAKTTLYPGAVSKQVTGVMQIASYAGHGSSGSPVFDGRGLVVAIIWGGPQESRGQIIYAVPADRAAALIASQ